MMVEVYEISWFLTILYQLLKWAQFLELSSIASKKQIEECFVLVYLHTFKKS